MFRLSFLTILNIYKDYFKGRHKIYKCVKLDAKVYHKHIMTGDIYPSSSFFEEAVAFVHHRVL